MPSIEQIVAEAMGVEPELVPLLSELCRDLPALGGWPAETVELLRDRADLPPGARAVDLGCGQGAVAVAVARELGFRVLGVDLFEPFLAAGVAAAAAAGVDHLVSFRRGDLHEVVRGAERFDAAVFAAVGAGIFGDYAGCVGALRECVRPGGYLAISDGVLARARPGDVFPGYGYYEPHGEALRQLRAHGDVLVAETVIPPDRLEQQSLQDLEVLRANVDRLVEESPRRRADLEDFLVSQELEYRFIRDETLEVVWLLQRARS